MDETVVRLVAIISASTVRDRTYQDAERELIQLGGAAVPALELMLRSSDRVVSARANEILSKLQAADEPL